jgi:hypothetical protein
MGGSNPMELLHSSEKARSSSGKAEEIDLWRRYIMMTSNKIDIALIPKQLHHLHREEHRSVTENEKAQKKGACPQGGINQQGGIDHS